jgi:hypothetical protein
MELTKLKMTIERAASKALEAKSGQWIPCCLATDA